MITPGLLLDTVSLDLDRAFHYALLWGFEAVELRFVGQQGQRVPFVNEPKLLRRLEKFELPVTAVVPGFFEGDISARARWLNEVELLKEATAFCRRIGCSRIIVSSFLSHQSTDIEKHERDVCDAFNRAAEQVGGRDIKLLILNEPGMTCASARKLSHVIRGVSHPMLSAAWSPAESLMAGEPPEGAINALTGKVDIIRFRDVVMEGPGWREVTPGTGSINWESILRGLADDGFSGSVNLELFTEPKPREGLRAAHNLHNLLA